MILPTATKLPQSISEGSPVQMYWGEWIWAASSQDGNPSVHDILGRTQTFIWPAQFDQSVRKTDTRL